MIHFRKRLNILDIIKAIVLFRKPDLLHWKKNKDQKSLIVSKSSWSILIIGIWLKKIKKKEPVFLVPDYYCNYSLNLLKILGAKIIFYSIKKNFEPDLDSIKLSIVPDVIIATHYFGKEYDLSKLNDFCISKKIWLIEDATHCLKKNGNIGNYGHFVIYSQHKFFSNINGALLLLNNKKLTEKEIISFGDEDTWLTTLEKFVSDKKILTYKNSIRTILNIIYDNCIKIFLKEKIQDFDINQSYQEKYSNPNIDLISYKLLSLHSYKIGWLSDYRKRCHLIIEILLEKELDKNDYEILSNIEYDPYLLIIKSQNKTREIYKILKNLELAVQSWPDLPDNVSQNSDAHYLRNNLIFIPLNKICLNKISPDNHLQIKDSFKIVECFDKEKWEILEENYNSNILQTWEFGNFKNKNIFVKTKRYTIFDINEKIVGFFQSVQYQFLWIKFIFINRGPIIDNNINKIQKKYIYQKIVYNLKKNFFSFILIKPELKFNKENIILHHKNKISYHKSPFWSSSKIDLSEDESKIFKNFKNSLRAEILKGEKLVTVEFDNQQNNIDWICSKYFSPLNKKKFRTINKDLIKFLDSKKTISFCAVRDQKICSGIVFYCHGNTATYLMSYNSDIGKKNYGNQILLWEMIKHLKKKNYSFIDLGGIDSDYNINVAKFKLAFNGKLYKLVGTNFI